MKKSLILVLFIVFILSGIIFIKSLNAQETGVGEVVPGLSPENLEKVQTGIEKLTDEEARKQYLSQEWGKILQNNTYYIKYIKPSFDVYDKTAAPFINPISEYTIGMAPNFSWIFLLTLVLWIAFVVYFFRIFSLVPVFSKNTQKVITIGFIIIFSLLRITKTIAEQIVKMVSAFDTTKQLIAMIVIITAIILLSIFSKTFRNLIGSSAEQKAKKEEEKDREKLKADREAADILTSWLNKK